MKKLLSNPMFLAIGLILLVPTFGFAVGAGTETAIAPANQLVDSSTQLIRKLVAWFVLFLILAITIGLSFAYYSSEKENMKQQGAEGSTVKIVIYVFFIGMGGLIGGSMGAGALYSLASYNGTGNVSLNPMKGLAILLSATLGGNQTTDLGIAINGATSK